MDESEVSASTLYRYHQANRLKQIEAFRQFKHEFQNFFSPEQVYSVKQIYKHGICGRNDFGEVVLLDKIGQIKVNELWKTLDDDAFVGYANMRLLQLSEKVLRETEKVYWICDVGGKVLQLASKKTIDVMLRVIDNAQQYFPGMLARIVFVNTPMLFDTVFDRIYPKLHKTTQQAILRLEDNYELLYEHAPPKILPEYLGGERSDNFFLEAEESSQESEEEEEYDFSALRNAFSAKMGHGAATLSVSQTPLNTEADDQ